MTYTDKLVGAVSVSGPLLGNWKPMPVYPCFVGIVHPDHKGMYMATPGWDDEALPVEWQSENGVSLCVESKVSRWTGDLEKDVEAWRSAMTQIIRAQGEG